MMLIGCGLMNREEWVTYKNSNPRLDISQFNGIANDINPCNYGPERKAVNLSRTKCHNAARLGTDQDESCDLHLDPRAS